MLQTGFNKIYKTNEHFFTYFKKNISIYQISKLYNNFLLFIENLNYKFIYRLIYLNNFLNYYRFKLNFVFPKVL